MEDFIDKDLYFKLREKGFELDKDSVIAYYDEIGNLMMAKDYWCLDSWSIAPTISQVLRWFRDVKKIYCLPHFEQGIDKWFFYVSKPFMPCEFPEYMSESDYETYELAAIEGIKWMVENIELE